MPKNGRYSLEARPVVEYYNMKLTAFQCNIPGDFGKKPPQKIAEHFTQNSEFFHSPVGSGDFPLIPTLKEYKYDDTQIQVCLELYGDLGCALVVPLSRYDDSCERHELRYWYCQNHDPYRVTYFLARQGPDGRIEESRYDKSSMPETNGFILRVLETYASPQGTMERREITVNTQGGYDSIEVFTGDAGK